MKIRGCLFVVILFVALSTYAFPAFALSDETEVRGVVERVFQQLRSGDYGALYDVLPANSQSRVTRERFTSMLKGTRDVYDRIRRTQTLHEFFR